MESEERKSKSQVKREMHAIEKLGERLMKLPQQQVQALNLPATLAEAIEFSRTITSHGARKRQLKYIGVLMREIDPEPILAALGELDGDNRAQAEHFQEIERLRDDLLADSPSAMEEIVERFPQVDRQRLMQLVRNARKEKEAGRPPKSYRALFAYLRELFER